MNSRTHRLATGYAHEDLVAFLHHFAHPLDLEVTGDQAGRFKLRYSLQVRLADGSQATIPVAESFYSLRRGWCYALPPGTPADPAGAAATARGLSNRFRSQ